MHIINSFNCRKSATHLENSELNIFKLFFFNFSTSQRLNYMFNEFPRTSRI